MLRDDNGIPQIYADTDADLFRAQGFVAGAGPVLRDGRPPARHAGRLCRAVRRGRPRDRQVRSARWAGAGSPSRSCALLDAEHPALPRGLRRRASTPTSTTARLDRDRRWSTPCSALDRARLHARGRGRPVDSLAWLKAMAWDLRGNMDDEIDRVLAGVDRTPEQVAELYPTYPYDRAPADRRQRRGRRRASSSRTPPAAATRNPRRPPYTARDGRRPRGVQRRASTRCPTLLGRGDGIGSNSWVVDGEHTATGKPLLANDPHLGVSLPGIWYQMGLHCRQVSADCPFDVVRLHASPACPGVVIGHNERHRLGLHQPRPRRHRPLPGEGRAARRWLYDGEAQPLRRSATRRSRCAAATTSSCTIRVDAARPAALRRLRGAQHRRRQRADATSRTRPARQRLRRRAAVDRARARPRPPTRSSRSTGRRTGTSSGRPPPTSRCPAQNLVYADTRGPHRLPGAGPDPDPQVRQRRRLPAAGLAAGERLDRRRTSRSTRCRSVLDPDEGFVVTANQAVTGPDYPYFLTDDWDYGYRVAADPRPARRQEGELVGRRDDRGSSSTPPTRWRRPWCRTCSTSTTCADGYFRDGQRAAARLGLHASRPTRAAAAYYNVGLEQPAPAHLPRRAARGAAGPTAATAGSRWSTQLLRRPGQPLVGRRRHRGVVETRDDILRQALADARDELTRRQARDPDQLDVGPPAPARPAQPDARASPGSRRSSGSSTADGYEVGGGSSIVDATGWDAARGLRRSPSAPSMRMVVSLADLDDSRWINLTGVSGHAFRPTTPTRPSCGSTATPAVGRSRATPSRRPARTR